MTRLRRSLRTVLIGVFFADAITLAVLIWLAWQTRITLSIWERQSSTGTFPPDHSEWWILLVWLVLLVERGAYTTRLFGEGPEEFRQVALASVLAASAVAWFCYGTEYRLSRGFVVLVFVYGIPGLLFQRFLLRKVLHRARRARRLTHNVLAVGPSEGILELMGVLERESYAGYRVVAAILTDEQDVSPELGIPVVETLDGLVSTCERVQADTVLVARGGLETSAALRRISWELEGTPLELVVVPSLTDVAGPRIQMRPVAGLPLLHVEHPTTRLAGRLPKRVFDIIGSLLVLVVVSPIMAAVALAIRFTDRGPIFYKQERVGRNGETFKIVKFRSMYVDADRREAELRSKAGHEGALWKMEDDPRITPIGKFIRRFSIDELPQIFNVLVGDMSLVGPRPQQVWEVETYEPDVHRRLAVRPGMTGLWQVSGRSDLNWKESVRLDLYYVDNWSLTTDLVIILKTVKAVLAGSGAY